MSLHRDPEEIPANRAGYAERQRKGLQTAHTTLPD